MKQSQLSHVAISGNRYRDLFGSIQGLWLDGHSISGDRLIDVLPNKFIVFWESLPNILLLRSNGINLSNIFDLRMVMSFLGKVKCGIDQIPYLDSLSPFGFKYTFDIDYNWINVIRATKSILDLNDTRVWNAMEHAADYTKYILPIMNRVPITQITDKEETFSPLWFLLYYKNGRAYTPQGSLLSIKHEDRKQYYSARGYKFMLCDIKQSQVSIIKHYLGLCGVSFCDKDIYLEVANSFNLGDRETAKKIVVALINGANPISLAHVCGKDSYHVIYAIEKMLCESLPFGELQKRLWSKIVRRKYLSTLLGRLIHIENTSERLVLSHFTHQIEADLIFRILIELGRNHENDISIACINGDGILLQVRDSIEYSKITQTISTALKDTQIEMSYSIGNNWGELRDHHPENNCANFAQI